MVSDVSPWLASSEGQASWWNGIAEESCLTHGSWWGGKQGERLRRRKGGRGRGGGGGEVAEAAKDKITLGHASSDLLSPTRFHLPVILSAIHGLIH